MLIASNSQLDFVWKVLQHRGLTSTEKRFFEEAVSSSQQSYSQDVWIQDSGIPSTPPGASGAIVQVVSNLTLTRDPSVGGSRVWAACSTPGVLSSRLGRWIPPRFGRGYAPRLYEDDGLGGLGPQVTDFDPISWMFFQFGVLFCEYSPATAGKTLPFHLSGYRYTGAVGAAGGVDLVALDQRYARVWEHEQIVAATTWEIEHDLGTEYVGLTVYKAGSPPEVIIPDSAYAVDPTHYEITFSVATAGRAVLVGKAPPP